MAKSGRGRAWFATPVGRIARWVTAGLWLIALVVATPLAGDMDSVQSDQQIDQLPADAESTRLHELSERLPGTDGDQVFVVYHRDSGITPDDLAAANGHRQAIAGLYGDGMPPVPSEDNRTLMYAVDRADPQPTEEATTAFVKQVREIVATHPAGLTAAVTGPSAIGTDIDAVFEGIDTTLMLVTVAVVAFLLIVTYRSPFLWLIPLASVGAAAVLSMAAVYAIASLFDFTVSTQSFSIMIVMVFGAGTDYALLLVARYREELRRVADARDAMRAALRGVGPAVLASGGTVTLGLLCMLVAKMNDIAGIGAIGAIGIACTLVTMLTLFPVLLVSLGRKVFWPRVPGFGVTPPAHRNVWGAIATSVTARPARTAGVTVAVLGALSFGMLSLSGTLTQADSFTTTPESVTGYQTLAKGFPERGGRPLTVAVRTDQVDPATTAITGIDGIADVEPDRSGDGWTLLDVSPTAAPDSAAEADTVARLRAGLAPFDALVGGEGAERVDVEAATAADTRLVIPLVLLVVIVVLGLLLRAVAASALTVAAVVLSFTAALGVGALAFGSVFDFVGSEPSLPLMCFVFLVALGVDYAIFLVARIRDDVPELGTVEATKAAVASTGPVIASAGVVLAATFAVLTSLPFVPMVQMGFVLAVGVLLQTLVVQPALVAPMIVATRRAIWWPGTRSEPVPVGVGG